MCMTTKTGWRMVILRWGTLKGEPLKATLKPSIILRDLLVLLIRTDGLQMYLHKLASCLSLCCHINMINMQTLEVAINPRGTDRKVGPPGSWNVDQHPADNVCSHLESAHTAFQLYSLLQPRYSALKPQPALTGSTAQSLHRLDFSPSGSKQYLCPADWQGAQFYLPAKMYKRLCPESRSKCCWCGFYRISFGGLLWPHSNSVQEWGKKKKKAPSWVDVFQSFPLISPSWGWCSWSAGHTGIAGISAIFLSCLRRLSPMLRWTKPFSEIKNDEGAPHNQLSKILNIQQIRQRDAGRSESSWHSRDPSWSSWECRNVLRSSDFDLSWMTEYSAGNYVESCGRGRSKH